MQTGNIKLYYTMRANSTKYSFTNKKQQYACVITSVLIQLSDLFLTI